MATKIILVIISIVLGMAIALIGLNAHSHGMIDKNPNITLKQYWDGNNE